MCLWQNSIIKCAKKCSFFGAMWGRNIYYVVQTLPPRAGPKDCKAYIEYRNPHVTCVCGLKNNSAERKIFWKKEPSTD